MVGSTHVSATPNRPAPALQADQHNQPRAVKLTCQRLLAYAQPAQPQQVRNNNAGSTGTCSALLHIVVPQARMYLHGTHT